MMKPLVVVGSINADLVLSLHRLPEAGETLAAEKLEQFPGGKGANQAAAAAKLGYPTYMVGQLGQDGSAQVLRQALTDCGVNDSHVREVEGSTGTAVILLQPTGENSIMIVGGANMAHWELDQDTKQLISTAGAVLLQREIPEEVNIQAAQVASAAGVPVVLDAGGQEGKLPAELLKHITVLSPNETELSRLTGCSTGSDEEILVASRQLQRQGVKTVLVKLGSKGSMVVTDQMDGGWGKVAAYKVDKVVDTTGAGDCFTGSFAVALLEGKSYIDAMRFAGAAAAVCVQRKGAMPSLPLREEALAMYHSMANAM